ncbi:UDP-N-acetylmuramate--L-alanine ligase [Salana multivorans]|uniref:UDP-N-acetylmuramate--L-alanine ligase n=1 Tax=Salana multivorans TaxID=120377 RepID=UPI000A76C92D|nr:UDP-N-acetylmuramate--L-alanine ligase [Salana multivorans]
MSPTQQDPAQHWHFVAIGGHGMSVLAEIALEQGHRVTGSDQVEGEETLRLRERGARVDIGHAAEQVDGADVVVVSTAIPATNVEVVRARELGIEVVHRSVAMARLAAGRSFYAVAGTHGKTTVSAMLAVALHDGAGADPGAAIGGTVLGWGSGSRVGTGPFVAEADESDESFLNYAPSVAIVTNVEADHLAHYTGGLPQILAAFEEFTRRIVPGGLLVAFAGDEGSLRVARTAAGEGVRVRTYGREAAPDVGVAGTEHVLLTDLALTGASAGATLTLHRDGVAVLDPVRIDVAAPGLHTILDAAAAWAAALEATDGSPASALAVAEALTAFRGAGRRFETVGEADGVRVVDDYAHNPRKVENAVRAGRLAVGDGRLVVLFQPALFTRTRDFAEEFADALDGADAVVVTDVFGSREAPIDGVTSALITDAEPAERAERGAMPFLLVPDRLDAARRAADLAGPGDLVMTVGSGDVTLLAPVVLERLAARAGGAE